MAAPKDGDDNNKDAKQAASPDSKSASKAPAAAAGKATAPPPLGSRADFVGICIRTSILCLASGMVNVVAILHAGMTVAHHTGNTSHFGRLLGIDAARFGLLMLGFLFGSLVAGAAAANMDAHFAGGRSMELLVSAIAVAVGALVASTSSFALTAVTLFAFSQGLQNAVTSQFSGMPLRTTHTTGTLTDIGIFLGQCIRAAFTQQPMPPMKKPAILALSIGSFGLGGLLSKLVFSLAGAATAIIPAVAVAVTALCPPASEVSTESKEKAQ